MSPGDKRVRFDQFGTVMMILMKWCLRKGRPSISLNPVC